MSNDFATLYISDDLEADYKINYPDIFREVLRYILSKNIHVNLIISVGKNGKRHTGTFINSRANNDLHWRIKLNTESFKSYKKLYISLSPEFKNKKTLNLKQIEDIAIKDIGFFKNNIGDNINITVKNASIIFNAFSYSQENKISINNWNVNLDQNESETYENFINHTSVLLNSIKNQKPFKFRIVNLTGQSNNSNAINNIISILNKYGNNLNLYYNNNSYTNIKTLANNKDTINIILINKNDKQAYYDSKEFFLEYNMPFQHIRVDGNLLNNPYAQNIMILEIYKKTHIQDFYLSPDHFLNEPISGFIYLDVDSIYDYANKNYSNYLTISYIFSENLNYSEEKVLSINNIEIHTKRDYMNIIDVENAVKFILSGN